MKIKSIFSIALLSLAGFSNAYAEHLDAGKAYETCMKLSQEIFDKVLDSPEMDECSRKVLYSGSFVRTAAKNIQEANYPLAVIHLLDSERSMRFVAMQTNKCPDSSSFIKPYIPMVMALEKELADEAE